MEPIDLDSRIQLLAHTPLFSNLHAEELREVAAALVERTYRKGETVCEVGEPGGSFQVVAHGELEVYSGGAPPRLLNRLGAGDFLGEMSLLFEGHRSATVRASRTATLLELGREDFQRYLGSNARVLHYFASVLSQRLAANAAGPEATRGTCVIAVSGPPRVPGKSLVARSLSALLHRLGERPVLRIELRPEGRLRSAGPVLQLSQLETQSEPALKSLLVDDPSGVAVLPVVADASATSPVRVLNALIHRAESAFPYLVIDVAGPLEALRAEVRQVADVSVELVEQGFRAAPEEPGAGRVYRVLNRFHPGSLPVPISHCEPFVLPDDPALPRSSVSAALYVRDHPGSPLGPPLHRLARKILGTTVGVAMGGGAAFGISHIGVLRVLEDAGIPVDLLAGTSMGSIVALGRAAGLSPAEMLEIASRIGNVATTLSALDFTLGRPGLLAGKRLVQIFKPLLGATRRFDQLRYPCRAVAADVETGERVALGEGALEEAFRASCSVPMLWVPIRSGDRVLIDGGMVDPVPADVVREMGADICIAVNVVPPLRRGVSNAITRLWRSANALNPLAYIGRGSDLPTSLDIFMNTIQMLQHELGNFNAISADVRIVPDLSEFTWVEFYRPAELIARGAQAAEAALPEIRRVLAERRAAAG